MDFGMEPQGRYIIISEIASGGTATVFLAKDMVLQRKVALKKLHPHLHNHPEMVRRFEKEAVAVASLSHENVIKVYDYGREANQGLFLAMEYVDGVSLDTLLRESGGTLPCLSALSLFHQLLEGLAAAHAHGICHRDIKPSNVLVDGKGCVRIADFGIAFLSSETSITKTGSYLGTPGYSAPEQAEGKTVTVKTDIFAAGSLLFRSLTGRLPFEAETPHAVLVAIMEKTPARVNLVNPRVIPGMADLVERMLSKSPLARPSASECAAELVSLAQSLGLPLDAGRICRLREDPGGYAAKDHSEVAHRYLRQARLVDKLGKGREAMKLYALAGIFAERGSEIATEVAGYLRARHAAAKRRMAAAVSGSILLIGAALYMGGRYVRGVISAKRAAASAVISARSVETSPIPAAHSPTALAVDAGPVPVVAQIPPSTHTAGGSSGPAAKPASPLRPRLTPRVPKPPASRSLPPESVSTAPAPVPPSPSAAAQGFLWVKTNPPFARVTVDGKDFGKTPLQSPVPLASGAHRLDLERDGCEARHSEFTIAPAETTSLRFTMDRIEEP